MVTFVASWHRNKEVDGFPWQRNVGWWISVAKYCENCYLPFQISLHVFLVLNIVHIKLWLICCYEAIYFLVYAQNNKPIFTENCTCSLTSCNFSMYLLSAKRSIWFCWSASDPDEIFFLIVVSFRFWQKHFLLDCN